MMDYALMFVTMVLLQVFVMPFVMVADPADVYFSRNQVYMGAFMGAAMVAVDGAVHGAAYMLRRIWTAQQDFHGHLSWVGIIGALVVAALAVVAYRRQWTIDDKQYLRDMIPHHSMAILTSRPRVQSADPRIARLAEQILVAQTREIAEMRHLLRSG